MGWGKEWELNIKPEWVKDAATYSIVQARELNNLKPTHDPYTNPNAMIYYECNCGAILDPKTKSFAALNNAASVAGWKVRFGDVGYVPYCSKCGEGVE